MLENCRKTVETKNCNLPIIIFIARLCASSHFYLLLYILQSLEVLLVHCEFLWRLVF